MQKRFLLHLLPAVVLCLGACDDGGDDGGDGDGDGGSDGDSEGDSGGDVNCGDGTGPSYAATVKPIMDANCVTDCHEPGGIWSLVDLSGDSYAAMVNVTALQVPDLKFVEPCDANASYLWHKLAGTHSSVGGGTTKQMPLDSATCDANNYLGDDCGVAPLSAADIAAVEDWINLGTEP